MDNERITSANINAGEMRSEVNLRPQYLDDYIGQQGVKQNLKIFIEAAKLRGEPLDHVLPSGEISDGTEDMGPSFFREYKFKLEKLYDKFYTAKGAALARQRREIAKAFYESLYREVNTGYTAGKKMLQECLR